VIDDYGHAPAEITATLQSAREVFGEKAKILCIFQPHQYSRTYYLLKEFGGAFNLADKVYIPNIYRSRDTASDLAKVNVDTLVKEINLNKSELAENSHDFDETFQKTLLSAAHYDAIITMGAGDITNLSTRLSGS
jgi:UDP-N-acetylmuramate--alanine ligase